MEAASLEMYHKLWNFVLVDAAVKPRAKQLFPPFNMNGYSSNLIFGSSVPSSDTLSWICILKGRSQDIAVKRS